MPTADKKRRSGTNKLHGEWRKRVFDPWEQAQMGMGGNGCVHSGVTYIHNEPFCSILFFVYVLLNLDKRININNEDSKMCYVEPMFLSNKSEVIYKIVYIVEKSNKHTSQFLCISYLFIYFFI